MINTVELIESYEFGHISHIRRI